MAAYGPPSHPPPPSTSASFAPPTSPPPPQPPSSSPDAATSSSARNPYGPWPYAPTSTPTPGQPMLCRGRMLVYPRDWAGCPKCNNTGYRHADPSSPCRRCWDRYGQKPNQILISSASMRGANVLQRPLPGGPMGALGLGPSPGSGPGSGFGSMMPGTFPLGGRMSSINGPGSYMGFPGALVTDTGSSGMSNWHSGTGFIPPQGPPPPAPPRRPPPVSRANNEEDLNEEGEAPPAYEDAVAAGPDGVLPPQRRQQPGENDTAGHGPHASGRHSPLSMMQNMQVSPGPHPYHQQQPLYHPQMPFNVLPMGAMPPPHALPVAPGDPRIGGRLCYKCDGRGVRDTIWLTEETCNRCNGIGRLL